MKKILIIDDDKDILFLLEKIIERCTDYTVVTVENGAQAQVWLGKNHWDLVITDVELPDCSGLSMVEQIRKHNPDAKVLMITGHHDTHTVIDALHLKVDAFLLKPFERNAFITQVKELVNTTKPSRSAKKILAIGAHPDDVEIGCGGTLLKHILAGDSVSVLTLSNGAQGGNPAVRAFEAQSASELMGADLTMCDLQDTQIQDGPETIGLIEAAINKVKPDLVYTHSRNDAHQDHRNVYQATLVAARAVASVACYQSPSATTEFRPSRFVDISDHLNKKLQLIECYQTQTDKCKYLQKSVIESTAAYWGRFANYKPVEPFEVVRSV